MSATTSPNWQALRALLFVALAISTYLFIPLVSGGRLLVPSFPTVALAPLLFLVVHRDFTMTDKVFLLKIAFVLLLSIALSPGYVHLKEKFLSLIQFGLALVVSVMTIRLMQQLRRDVLERALAVVWSLLIVGCALEIAGITQALSDHFRLWAYSGMYTLYESDLRDINFVGWVRPRVFGIEPSTVSKMFIAAINAWLLVRVTATKVAVVAVATGVMLVIMGSPMYAVSAAMTAAILVWNSRATLRARVATVVAMIAISVAFVTYFGDSALSTLVDRVDKIGATQSGGDLEMRSENLRAVVPWLTLVDIWGRWPLFGVGFGGKEVVVEVSMFSDTNYRTAMGANAAAEIGTYLGIIGSAMFIWILITGSLYLGIRRVGLMLVIMFLFSMLMGGVDSFRYWGHITLLWGALAIADSGSKGDRAPALSDVAADRTRDSSAESVRGNIAARSAGQV